MASASATTSSERSLTAAFDALRSRGRKALVVYMTAGHPDAARSLELLRGLADAGADVIELGIPFSDPMADGPVIQASSQQALAGGMTVTGALNLLAQARPGVPVVLFSYLNPILAAGAEFEARAAERGAAGLLITDLPVGTDEALETRFASGPLEFIRLVAPTTPADRMAVIARHGSGFVYLISRLGVTGTRDTLPDDLAGTVDRLRRATALPVCVGFGISTPAQAAEVSRLADGVVVGSALVRAADESVEQALTLVRRMRAAIDDAARG